MNEINANQILFAGPEEELGKPGLDRSWCCHGPQIVIQSFTIGCMARKEQVESIGERRSTSRLGDLIVHPRQD